MRATAILLIPISVVFLVAGCAYPRRSTALSTVGGAMEAEGPNDVWSLRIVSAELPPLRSGGLAWDDDGSPPDAFVRIYRKDVLVFETPVAKDTREPRWNAVAPKNVWLPRSEELRIELWDQDGIQADPIGRWRNTGLPATALLDADARIQLSNDASLILRIERPVPHRGVGITLYESRNDEVLVLEVLSHSPAGRAGIKPGDRIVEIGGRSVGDLGGPGTASALSMAQVNKQRLLVVDNQGKRREVELDDGFIWFTL